MRPVFLLGVGCQKGGTTWLHHHLAEHPSADMGFQKEYHVLDTLFVPHYWGYDPVPRSMIRRAYYHVRAALGSEAHQRQTFISNLDNYFAYFEGLIRRRDGVTLTGDISPGYAGLPAPALARVKMELEKRNFDVRIVFLMRDPVERIISSCRMQRRGGFAHRLPDGTLEPEAATIARQFSKPHFVAGTTYERTIDNLESVFNSDEIHYEFYERLFTEVAIRRMFEFLRLPYRQPNFELEVNVSRNDTVIDDELRRRIFTFYAPTYARVASRFGQDMMRSLWPNYRRFA